MPDVPLPFTREEYATRLAKVRSAMDRAGLEVLIATDPSNMAWLTGYDGWSFYTHQAVIVTHEGEPTWWGRLMDSVGAARTVYMDETSIVGYPDDFVQSTEIHPHQHLAEHLEIRDLGSARVGVEMDNYYYSAAAHAHFTEGLGDATVLDATGLVNWQRAVKSE
ncbi:MAG TPA: aminopeptidase P family N-terminal domain-containing protein, partial [Acidimicrobiia bacterium]|nr:aminopeptidase P family N-terminal domain-containing protein [Acidimicrobiia bacterium]